MSNRTLVFLMALIAFPAHAVTIGIIVIDADTVSLTLSGTITGPMPIQAPQILYVDTTVPKSLTSPASSITGDAMLGPQPIIRSHSGYNNAPYEGTLQLEVSSSNILQIGYILSGNALIDFSSPHGMTQSMFDGGGVPVYWGSGVSVVGTLQGYAVSPVPLPAAAWLFLSALAGLFGVKHWRTKSLAYCT